MVFFYKVLLLKSYSVYFNVNNSIDITVFKEIFAPVLFSSLLPSLSAGEFKTGRNPMSQTICLNTTLSGRILNGAKPFVS